MQKLLKGLQKFQSEVFHTQRALFESLADGQSPETLFITCSDSRIVPSLLTQSGPGELFILRNAGNIVPPYGVQGGESATLEYAIAILKVRDIVVCGHSDCGAVKALLQPPPAGLSQISAWLRVAEPTRHIIEHVHGGLQGPALVRAAIEQNVLVQLDNLRTHPAVASGLRSGTLHLHGWVYDVPTGQVRAHDPESGEFRTLLLEPEAART